MVIWSNPKLDDCSALRKLLDSTDDAEPGPGPGGAGVPDVGGDVILANNLPAKLEQQVDAVLQQDESMFVLFDPQSGELHRGQSMLCAHPGPSIRVFKNGFE